MPVHMGSILAINAAVILAIMVALWGLSLRLRDVSLVDIAWGAEFVVIAWVTFVLSAGVPGPSRILLPVLTTIWGLRLAIYLFGRKWNEHEDPRYQRMRAARGAAFWWQSLYVVFLLQGLLLWVIALPLQVGIAQAATGWTPGHAVGAVLWGVGFVFESLGDWQLAQFRRDPQNRSRVMDRGLWRYTRHPNYFGDFCIWWGLGLIATAHGEHFWTLVGPLVMSVLLLRISGVTLLESTLKVSRPGYADYIRRTSAFFPWPPKARETERPTS